MNTAQPERQETSAAGNMKAYFAALYCEEPHVGDKNPPGEAAYKGYERVPVMFLNGTNLTAIRFPRSEGPSLVVTHIAVLTAAGIVKKVAPL